jgi:hypothetical protein
MKTLGFILLAGSLLPIAQADTISMKNGDVYHASILKINFGDSVQILLIDGSEKHLLWNDVGTIERDSPAATSAPVEVKQPEKTVEMVPALVESERRYASEMLNDENGSRFELEFTGMTFDTLWQTLTYHTVNGDVNGNATIREVRTLPEEITARFYASRLHFYFDYQNQSTTDQSFSSLAVAYGIAKGLDVGLAADFRYYSGSTSDSISATGSDYIFGPFMRVVMPISDRSTLEMSGTLGPSFRRLTINDGNISLTGSAANFAAEAKIAFAVYLTKRMSYLISADGWVNVGSMSGTIQDGTLFSTGTLDNNIYRLRLMPIGLRIAL